MRAARTDQIRAEDVEILISIVGTSDSWFLGLIGGVSAKGVG